MYNVWYENSPLGAATIGKMMAVISDLAGLSYRYTNHSIRVTCVTVLDSKNFEARHIMAISKHKSEALIRSYSHQVTNQKCLEMASALADSLQPNKMIPHSSTKTITTHSSTKMITAHSSTEKIPPNSSSKMIAPQSSKMITHSSQVQLEMKQFCDNAGEEMADEIIFSQTSITLSSSQDQALDTVMDMIAHDLGKENDSSTACNQPNTTVSLPTPPKERTKEVFAPVFKKCKVTINYYQK